MMTPTPAGSRNVTENEDARRSLLMIAYKFPPMHSISCNRTRAICEGMRKYFDDVHVVTTTNRHTLQQDNSQPVPANVTDAWTLDYRTVFQGKRKAAAAGEGYKTSRLGKFFTRLQHSFPTLHVFGEGNVIYIRNGFKAASRILNQHNITHVFSTFPPYADHLIAYRLKKQNPRITWIADFRDLHVDPAQDNLFSKKFQLTKNREILRYADVVTTVSEGLATHLRALHPNVQVLRNGLHLKDNIHNTIQYPKFTIAYTGSMFQDKRKPDALLEALKNLIDARELDPEKPEIRYAGKDGSVWQPLIRRFELTSIFTDHGLVSKQEADQIQRKSHINLLLTYSTPELKGNLTGKLADYLCAGRQIMILINGPRDTEIEEMIRETRSGRVFYQDDVEKIQAWILHLYHKWQNSGAVANEATDETLKGLAWDTILEDFAQQNALIETHSVNNHK